VTQKKSLKQSGSLKSERTLNSKSLSEGKIEELENKLTGELLTLGCCFALLRQLQERDSLSNSAIRLMEALTVYASSGLAKSAMNTCAQLRTLTSTYGNYSVISEFSINVMEAVNGFDADGDAEARLYQR
jgi:hypothetical protein